jgi:hypothetical protein
MKVAGAFLWVAGTFLRVAEALRKVTEGFLPFLIPQRPLFAIPQESLAAMEQGSSANGKSRKFEAEFFRNLMKWFRRSTAVTQTEPSRFFF